MCLIAFFFFDAYHSPKSRRFPLLWIKQSGPSQKNASVLHAIAWFSLYNPRYLPYSLYTGPGTTCDIDMVPAIEESIWCTYEGRHFVHSQSLRVPQTLTSVDDQPGGSGGPFVFGTTLGSTDFFRPHTSKKYGLSIPPLDQATQNGTRHASSSSFYLFHRRKLIMMPHRHTHLGLSQPPTSTTWMRHQRIRSSKRGSRASISLRRHFRECPQES